jgi:hypothetical protein
MRPRLERRRGSGKDAGRRLWPLHGAGRARLSQKSSPALWLTCKSTGLGAWLWANVER